MTYILQFRVKKYRHYLEFTSKPISGNKCNVKLITFHKQMRSNKAMKIPVNLSSITVTHPRRITGTLTMMPVLPDCSISTSHSVSTQLHAEFQKQNHGIMVENA